MINTLAEPPADSEELQGGGSSRPDVSVIIPAFNTERFLATAIHSALAQPECKEVFVIDDGSTDGSLAIARSFDDPRLVVLTNGRNRGPSYTRNRGLDAATGRWIALLDSDDWYAPGRLHRLRHIAEAHFADMVADDTYIIDDGATSPHTTQFALGRYRIEGTKTVSTSEFVRSNRPGLSCARLGVSKPLMRTEFLRRHGLRYDDQTLFCEDFRLYLLCLLNGARFVVTPEPLYYRRRRTGSTTLPDATSVLATSEARLIRGNLDSAIKLREQPQVQGDVQTVEELLRREQLLRDQLAYVRFSAAARERRLGQALHELLERPSLPVYLSRKFRDRLHRKMHRLNPSAVAQP